MTTRSACKPGGMISTSVLWMTGFFFVTSALCGAHAEQQNPAKATTFGYVINVNDNTVSVIDTINNTVVATIPVGSAPNGVAITPDGTRPNDDDGRRQKPLAYVTNEADNTVSVIDTASNTVVATIPVRQEPNGVAVTPDGTHAYVTNKLDDSVSVIDTSSNTVVATVPGFVLPTGVAATRGGTGPYERDDRRHQSLAYVTNYVATIDGSNLPASAVSVIDSASNTLVATIPVGQFPNGVAITPDGNHAYVANQGDHTVSVIDTARNKVVATISVGVAPVGVATSHQSLAYVTNLGDNTVSVIDTARNKVVATIPVGTGPFAVALVSVTPSHPSSDE
jgi:YVTN family beta-propeller protein